MWDFFGVRLIVIWDILKPRFTYLFLYFLVINSNMGYNETVKKKCLEFAYEINSNMGYIETVLKYGNRELSYLINSNMGYIETAMILTYRLTHSD